ncbi:hypothetical protein MXB_1572 [Myxobolus squamalis]|nr:hypothetical protein MXB_1572 [Myxobolus squamalis]
MEDDPEISSGNDDSGSKPNEIENETNKIETKYLETQQLTLKQSILIKLLLLFLAIFYTKFKDLYKNSVKALGLTSIIYSIASQKLFPRIRPLSGFTLALVSDDLKNWIQSAYFIFSLINIAVVDMSFIIFYIYIISKIKVLSKTIT